MPQVKPAEVLELLSRELKTNILLEHGQVATIVASKITDSVLYAVVDVDTQRPSNPLIGLVLNASDWDTEDKARSDLFVVVASCLEPGYGLEQEELESLPRRDYEQGRHIAWKFRQSAPLGVALPSREEAIAGWIDS